MDSTAEQVNMSGTSGSNLTFLDSEFRYVLFQVAYCIIFILGLVENVYVLYVLRCLREAKNMGEIRIYMTNLTIADLLFVLALPFWIDYYSHEGIWRSGEAICRLIGSLFFINTYCSVFFLGAISFNRYWAVTRPLDAASSDHRRRGIIVCVIIWLLTVSMAVPFLTSKQTNNDKNFTRCFEGYQNEAESAKVQVAVTHFAIIGSFFVVFFLVVMCNFLIAQKLLSQGPTQSTIISRKCTRTMPSTSRRPRGVKRRALQMLIAVVGVFVLCFLPHLVIQGPWTLAVLQIKEGWGHVNWSEEVRQVLNNTHQITWLLMGLNCILDPVVYCFATRNFRGFIMAHIKKVGKREGCSQTAKTQLAMYSRNQILRPQNWGQEHENGLI